jgi:serine/threonine protein kinase
LNTCQSEPIYGTLKVYVLFSRYEKIAKIGQGTFGEVFKARCRNDKNKIVALKKVLMDNEKEVIHINLDRMFDLAFQQNLLTEKLGLVFSLSLSSSRNR